MKLLAPTSIESVIEQSEHIFEKGTFEEFMRFMRSHLPGAARKDQGLFTKMGVAEFQNWQLRENGRRRLTDARILAVMRIEFPLNTGTVFIGSVEESLRIVQGIRSHYNRDGHHGPRPSTPSVRYGKFAVGDSARSKR